MLPSTLDMVPSPSTWNPRPSTLDKKIDSSLIDEAEGEIWSNLIIACQEMWQAMKERRLEINPHFSTC